VIVSDPAAAAAARISLFVGKGGVGKSTLATATAVRDARAGLRVLIVSTDQAHSIGDVLGTVVTRYIEGSGDRGQATGDREQGTGDQADDSYNL